MIAAIFDIEGTLFTHPMGRGFIEYAASHGRGLQAFAYYASILPIYSLSQLGVLPREAVNRTAISRMTHLIRGYTLAQAEAAFEWVAESYIFPSGRESVLDLWEHHRRLGHRLLIASGGLAPCVERIGRRLHAAGTAGTEAETRDGRYTGRIGSPVVIGREKAARVLRLVAQLELDVDWPASYAYADSIHDLPFLELAGNPGAVHPDPKLRRIARERNWRIVED
jgi:HAD superfamily hydrolase (TIGR01490 family)